MKIIAGIFALLLCAASLSSAQTLYEEDFSSAPENMQLSGRTVTQGGALRIGTGSSANSGVARLPRNFPVPEGRALEISVEVDPVHDEESGGYADAGLSLAMPSASSDPNRYAEPEDKVYVELAELADDTARFTITLDGQCISWWNRMRGDHGYPNRIDRREGPYLLKVVLIPRGEETGLRFFVEHGDRPLRLWNYDKRDFVKEWRLARPLTERNYIGLFARNSSGKAATTVFDALRVREISVEQAEYWMPSDEFVMENLDYAHPAMTGVRAARERGDMETAKRLLVEYFRTREMPKGPELDLELSRATAHGKEGNWREVSDNAIAGIYAKLSWFHGFSEPGELSREDGMPRWSRDPGFLNRHFHWDVMAYAWQTTKDPKYSKRLSEEVIDWVETEPTFWFNNPNLGGTLHTLDGTVIAEHMLWTGNIGRRLEITWWQMFEIMRKAPGFTDEAIFAYLDGVIRQCRLLTNHTVFLPWDDSGLHGAMALTKSSILFEMADEAPQWNEVGWDRVNYVVDNQFHPDGSHVSLSTGYNWASIRGIEHFYKYLKENDAEIPEAMRERVENMFFHPLALTRPDFGNIDLNDGGWSPIDNPCGNAIEWFPERQDYLFFQTRGEKGRAPQPPSMYFPNAGQYLMRTGWGPDEQYLFFDGGPWGASHGKFDGMNIYSQYGKYLLIRNAGRGAYSGVGNTIHAGKSLSFNTLSPDWAQQNSIPYHQKEMEIGMNPPERRWVNNEDFSFGEGQYLYGWHRPGLHIKGKQLRQVIFVKGEDPRVDGYYIVLDTVEPELAREYTWRHPWQLEPNQPQIQEDRSVFIEHGEAALRILPVDPAGDMQVEIVQGQESPELLGWRVYGESARPHPVPTYSWKAADRFSRAWVISMQGAQRAWPVKSVAAAESSAPGEIRFSIAREDGGTDHVLRRFPGGEPVSLGGERVEGDVVVVRKSATGRTEAVLDLTGGERTVAQSSGVEPAEPEPTLLEAYGVEEGADAAQTPPTVVNASFENPRIDKAVGQIPGWYSNSVGGTGIAPVSAVKAVGEAVGRQVAIIHQGGQLGQPLQNAEGRPILIAPGKTFRVRFQNLRHRDLNNVNMGIYLKAAHKDGPLLGEPFSFQQALNKPGVVECDLSVKPASELSKLLILGWEKLPMYLQFVNYSERVVLDGVQVGVVGTSGKVLYGNEQFGEPIQVTAEELEAMNTYETAPAGALVLENASFESPSVATATGAIEAWDSNSAAGTGTWPVSEAKAEGEADGAQVGVVHAGGFIGQAPRDAEGRKLAIEPGARYRVAFRNLRHREMANVNLGIYLLAGGPNGGRVAEAQSFFEAANQPGVVEFTFEIWPSAQLDASAAGWREEALYLKFQNFSERVVLDEVVVESMN